MSAKNKYATSFWLDEETRVILDELVQELGTTRSAVVREAIRRMRADPKMSKMRRLVAELSRVVEGKER